MTKRFFYTLLLSSFLGLNGHAQNIDSLERLLNRTDDTVKVNLLNDLSELYWKTSNYDRADSLALKAKIIAEKLDYPLGVYRSYKSLFMAANGMAQFTRCLDLLNRSIEVAEEELNRLDLVVDSKLDLAETYDNMHFNLKSMEFSIEAHAIAEKLSKKNLLAQSLALLGENYFEAGNVQLSTKFHREAAMIWNELRLPAEESISYSDLALVYSDVGEFDSAIYYHKMAIKTYERSGEGVNMAYLLAMFGKTYTKFKDYDHALHYFSKAIQWHKEEHKAVSTYAYCLLNICEISLQQNIYLKKYFHNDFILMTNYLEEAINLFKGYDHYPFLIRAYSALVKINEQTGNYRLANEYSKQILIAKDSLSRREQRAKVKELMIQYEVKENERQIDQLKKESSDTNLIITLLLGLLAVSLFSVLLFISLQKLRYRNEKRTLELVALRSQMNPHFIFNCLNSINLYIVKSQIIEATNYLTSFSKLMRSILDNSKYSTVTLREEIKTISLYLELEAMRFNNKFSYNIHVCDGLDAEQIKISPMIIQPFIENAVWHGIHHKNDQGAILITFTVNHNSLICTIEDNGVGRQKALEFEKVKSGVSSKKSKSYGIQITKDRLNLLSKKGLKTFIEITDLIDGNKKPTGTKVEIGLPFKKHS